MSDQASSTSDHSVDRQSLEQIIDAFETAWNRDEAPRLDGFLPTSKHPQHDEVITELLCVDLERRYKLGNPKVVTDYQREFPELLQHKHVLERLAFEEYRLRLPDGVASPAEYARKLGIRTDHWPQPTNPDNKLDAVARNALTNGVADEMQRIVGITQSLPKVGERFLNFEVEEQLGECKFGCVYLAKQFDLADRRVVIKVTSNLWCESDRLARLQHTNIVPIYSVHQHNGLQAVCMPFLGRNTLDALLACGPRSFSSGADLLEKWLGESSAVQAHGTLQGSALRPPQKLLDHLARLSFEQLCTWLMCQIAAGLAHAHDRGILHRDLKPANILLTDDGQAMILDFNLSADVVAGGRASLLIGGTLPYMAPEHLRAVVVGGDVDQRSDIYSLGVIFYELLTGELPFPVQPGSIIGNLSFLMNDRGKVLPRLRDLRPRLSRDVESILQRCLAPHPKDRYQSADEFRDDLDRHLHHLSLLHAPNRSPTERLKKWVRRHPSMTSASALSVLSLLVVSLLTCGLVVRGRELARHQAVESLREFQTLARPVYAQLSAAITDEEILQNGLREADAALAVWSADQPGLRKHRHFDWLTNAQQLQATRALQTLQFLVAGTLRKQALAHHRAESRVALLDEALRYNERACALNPSKPSRALLLQQAEIETDLGHHQRAKSVRESALHLADEDRDSRLMTAIQMLRSKDFSGAEAILGTINEARDFFTWFLLGNCRYALHRVADAESCFTAAAALWPEFYVSYFQRGICRFKLGRLPEAEDDFSQVLQRRPGHTSALINRALVRLQRRDFRGVTQDLTRAIEAGRDESLTYLLRARAWSALGHEGKAARDLQMGQAMQPVSVQGWIQRGLSRLPGDPAAALHDFDEALQLDPQSRKALQNKSAILSQCNRNEEAIETLSRLIDIYPRDGTMLLGRGLLRARLGDNQRAINDGVAGLACNDSPSHRFQMARILANTSTTIPQDAQKAIAYLRRALEEDPSLVKLMDRDADLKPLLDEPAIRKLLSAARTLSGNDMLNY